MPDRRPPKFPEFNPKTDGSVFDWILEAANLVRKRNKVTVRNNKRALTTDFRQELRDTEPPLRSTAR